MKGTGHAILWIGLALAALLSAGCKDNQDYTAQGMFKSLWAHESPSDLVRKAFDPNDADNRREGITELSKRDWGLREPYLEGYAKILQSDEDPLVRSAAARALGKARELKYLPVLAKALSDQVVNVRWDAALAAGAVMSAHRGDSPTGVAGPPLREGALRDSSSDVRGACARALGNYSDKETIKTLVECLYDTTFGVRYQAHLSLREIAGKDLGPDPESWTPLAEGAAASTRPAIGSTTKPWWDWASVTQKKSEQQIPTNFTDSEKPWWDWFGVSQKNSAQGPSSQPAPAPQPSAQGASASQPAGAARPWWDWMGVTQKNPASQPASRPAGAPASRPASQKALP